MRCRFASGLVLHDALAQLRVRPGRELTAHDLELLTAPALRRLIDGGVTTVIVPFGSIEDQNGHPPVGADSLLADTVGREVAERLEAVLAPTVRVGSGQHGMAPAMMSVPAETLTDTAVALAESLVGQGFRKIVFLPIHGGTTEPLQIAVARLNERFKDEGARASAPRGDVGPDPGSHSGKWLTSVMLAFHPDLVDLTAASRALVDELKDADAARGRARFERFVTAIVEATG